MGKLQILGVDQERVGVCREQDLPHLGRREAEPSGVGARPEVVPQVDPQQRLAHIDGPCELPFPRQAVDQLGDPVAVGLQGVVADAGVVQVVEGEVADELAVLDLLKVRLQILSDRPPQALLRQERALGPVVELGGSAVDPRLEQGDVVCRGL